MKTNIFKIFMLLPLPDHKNEKGFVLMF
ncbi:MAG: hypothetical protein ACD_72C00096G0005, partial [uncultured bacterium]